MTFKTINPATEEVLNEYAFFSNNRILRTLDETDKAWRNWKTEPLNRRTEKLSALGLLLRENVAALAEEITMEMGKPINQSRAEVEKCARVCEYYAQHGESFLQPEPVRMSAGRSYIRYEPLGPVLAIMPWNFPYWQVFRFAAPNLLAGNGCILKHAPNTTACALRIEQLFLSAGFPESLFSVVLADIDQIEGIIGSNKVAAVTLTGSTKAGQSVASLAGKYLKKTVLELGGSDAYLILDDADLQLAAEMCVRGRLINSGQSCIAAKRFIVTKKNEDRFIEMVWDLLKKQKVGDPMSEDTTVGPMARRDLRDSLLRQVTQSVQSGALCTLGGDKPKGKGFFLSPTLLTKVKRGMPAYDEELFGPVACVISTHDEKQMIDIANDTIYGLGSAVFSKDLEKAELFAQQLEAGCCFINDFVRSEPALPFGGVKFSGYGRELSIHGLKEFMNTKSIYIRQ